MCGQIQSAVKNSLVGFYAYTKYTQCVHISDVLLRENKVRYREERGELFKEHKEAGR